MEIVVRGRSVVPDRRPVVYLRQVDVCGLQHAGEAGFYGGGIAYLAGVVHCFGKGFQFLGGGDGEVLAVGGQVGANVTIVPGQVVVGGTDVDVDVAEGDVVGMDVSGFVTAAEDDAAVRLIGIGGVDGDEGAAAGRLRRQGVRLRLRKASGRG